MKMLHFEDYNLYFNVFWVLRTGSFALYSLFIKSKNEYSKINYLNNI